MVENGLNHRPKPIVLGQYWQFDPLPHLLYLPEVLRIE
jgi:hypothetical protein